MTSRPEEQRTISARRVALSAQPRGAFRLLVTSGPDRDLKWTLDPGLPSPLLVGTSPSCGLQLHDPAVSRRHLELEWTGDVLTLTDLGSSNGTRIGPLLVREAMLEGGETVRIGDTAILVERDVASAATGLSKRRSFGRLLGISREMRRLYPLCERLAGSTVPVVLEGETGTGKEVLAEALHEEGPRKNAPFIVFDCTTVAPNLVESELFGHEKGAFTGAIATKKGVFEEADTGTLLIDEIGDLPLDLQAKLLRALERSETRKVGATSRFTKFDVRVLAATRRDLDREVQAGRFRDDLFHRLAVARIELPPLRRRKGDVAVLVEHMASSMGASLDAIPAEILARWEEAPWPGNVRELRNAVARRLALGELETPPPVDLADDTMRDDTSPPITTGSAPPASNDLVERVLAERLPLVQAREKLVREFEARYVAFTLAEHGGNVTQAAVASGIARRHFQRVKKRANDEG